MNGVSVVKLDLVPLQKKVLDMFPHVTIWIDPAQGISYKQIFYEPGGDKRTATYKNIRYNQPIASDVFDNQAGSRHQSRSQIACPCCWQRLQRNRRQHDQQRKAFQGIARFGRLQGG